MTSLVITRNETSSLHLVTNRTCSQFDYGQVRPRSTIRVRGTWQLPDSDVTVLRGSYQIGRTVHSPSVSQFIPVSRLQDLVGAPWRVSFAKGDGHSFGADPPTSYVTLRNVAVAHCRARRWSSFSLLWHSPIDPTLLTGSENLAVLSPSCATVSLVTPQAYKTSCRSSFHSVQIEHRSIVLPHIETMDIDESGPHFRIFLNCWWKHATGLRLLPVINHAASTITR